MPRVAVVTGGTRGIGASICKALKAEGYKVAATYVGNESAARAFEAEEGISVFKFNVSDYKSCEEGVKEITETLGPIDVLVNNAGFAQKGDAFDCDGMCILCVWFGNHSKCFESALNVC